MKKDESSVDLSASGLSFIKYKGLGDSHLLMNLIGQTCIELVLQARLYGS